jgi:ubiquinone biosynthesis protein
VTDEWVEELEKLQNGAPTLPFDVLRPQVEQALGESVEQAFQSFDIMPLAAASIAQVHRATLRDGTPVVVKIRRPGIRHRMEADLRLLRHMAALAEANNADIRRFKPQALVDQLTRDILDELDFTREGRNADLLRADYAQDDRIVVPQIHWNWTSETLLVMDYIEGIPPRNPTELHAAGLNTSIIAQTGAELVLNMVLIHGRFHGDPHPGNLLCLSGNRIALLDLGSVGIVSPRRQHEFLTFIVGLQSGSASAIADMLMLWGKDEQLLHDQIMAAAELLVARHSGGPLVLSEVIADMFPMLRQLSLTLPPDLLLIFKALITIDGVLSRIEPDFDLTATLSTLRGKLLLSRLHLLQDRSRSGDFLLELMRLGEEAPRLMRKANQWLDRPPPSQTHLQAIDVKGIKQALWLISAAILLHLTATTFLSLR